MTRLAILGVSLLLIVRPAAAFTPAADEAYLKLVSTLREEIRAKAGGDGLQEKKKLFDVIQEAQGYQSERLPREVAKVEIYFDSEAAKSAASQLKEILEKDNKAQAEADLHAMQDRLEQVRNAVLAAKIPADLDPLAEELPMESSRSHSEAAPELRLLSTQLANANSFVILWQDYLAASRANDHSRVHAVLEKLVELKPDGIPIPRSKIMELLDAQSLGDDEAIQLVEKIQSLEEIRGVLALLQKPNRTSNQSNVRNQLSGALAGIELNYRNFLNGLPIHLESYGYGLNSVPATTTAKLWQLKSALMKLVLPRYLNAPPGTAARQDEDFNAFADRLIEEAKSRNDTLLAYRAREAKSFLSDSVKINPADTAGVTGYLAGKGQEEAGQYLLAVFSYQQSLSSGSDLIAAKLIGERLENIKASHPDDYREGTDRFLQSIAEHPKKN